MKKLFVFLMTLLFSTQTFALAAGTSGLQALVSELKVELSSAQSAEEIRDISINYSAQIRKVFTTATLEERRALRDELLQNVRPNVAADFRHLMTMVDYDKLSPDEQLLLLGTVIEAQAQQGASWDGLEDLVSLPIIIIALAVMANAFTCGGLFDALFGWKWWKNGCG